MIPELFIVGAGGFGREMYCWLQDLTEWARDWQFAGFLDDNMSALEGFDYDAEVVATASDFTPKKGQVFVCGIGNVEMKHKVCAPLLNKGADFIRIIHPSAVLGANVHLGAGVVVCPGVKLSCDIKLGDMVMLNLNTTIGHDASVDAWSTLSPQSNINGGVRIGMQVFLGSNATILPGISIGNNAFVGAGSVVMREVKPGQRVFGNPARAFNQEIS